MMTAAAMVAILGILALAWENGTLALACVGVEVILLCVSCAP